MEISRADGSVIAVEETGEPGVSPVLLCHGLADSRLSAREFAPAARDLGLRILAPDRPGTGGTGRRRLRWLADWADDARLILDGLSTGPVHVLGISAGGPFAAACAAVMPGRVRSLTLVSPLGAPGWSTRGMARGERMSLEVAGHLPEFGGWFLGRLAALARQSPGAFLRVTTSELPDVDRHSLEQPGPREAFLASYAEAFRGGSWGVAQDLRLLTRPWGFQLGSIMAPTTIHHGDADTTVPLQHARRYVSAIPGARLELHPGHGHFSILDAPEVLLAPLARPD